MSGLIAAFLLAYFDAGWGWWVLFGLILVGQFVKGAL
jgi:hypothetical protein